MKHFEQIFETLDRVGVRYVVVGGVAVNLHGHQRFTKDLDLALELAGPELSDALLALQDDGYRPSIPVRMEQFADPAVRERWVREKNMQVFQLYNDERRVTVDVMVRIPVPFEALWSRALDVSLERTSVKVASIPDLIEMKRGAGRPQDLADIEASRNDPAAPRGAGERAGMTRKEREPMNHVGWSYDDARRFRLRMSLRATPLERLRDLEDMIDFNAMVEAKNPHIKRAAEALASRSPGARRGQS